MGITNILRVCGVIFIIFPLGLFINVHIFTDSWFVENATYEHIELGKTMANILCALCFGLGILFLLSSFIKEVASSKLVLIGVTVSSASLLLSFIINEIGFAGSPPIPVWVGIALACALSLYARIKLNRV